jgi:FAD synthetase
MRLFIFLSIISFTTQAITVLVFGCFDLFHPGHHSFLQQAKKYGDTLIVIVTPDSIMQQLKGKLPIESEEIRLKNVRNNRQVDEVYLGDLELGTYKILKKINPDIICLGYDQKSLGDDLMKHMEKSELSFIKLINLEAYEPNKYHSSILRDFLN